MTQELQSTLVAFHIVWPALRNHIPCMAHIIQLALGAFMSSLSVTSRTMSWYAHERNQHVGENESIDIAKSQRHRKEGNAWIDKVLAIRPGLATILEKVRISRYFESPVSDLHIAANECCSDYTDTASSKQVHWLSKANVRLAVLPVMHVKRWWNSTLELHEKSYRLWEFTRQCFRHANFSKLLATAHNAAWMEHRQVCHGGVKSFPIQDPVDVQTAYGYSASRYHCLQYYVQ